MLVGADSRSLDINESRLVREPRGTQSHWTGSEGRWEVSHPGQRAEPDPGPKQFPRSLTAHQEGGWIWLGLLLPRPFLLSMDTVTTSVAQSVLRGGPAPCSRNGVPSWGIVFCSAQLALPPNRTLPWAELGSLQEFLAPKGLLRLQTPSQYEHLGIIFQPLSTLCQMKAQKSARPGRAYPCRFPVWG